MCGFLGLFKKEGLKKDDITSVKLSIKEISLLGESEILKTFLESIESSTRGIIR